MPHRNKQQQPTKLRWYYVGEHSQLLDNIFQIEVTFEKEKNYPIAIKAVDNSGFEQRLDGAEESMEALRECTMQRLFLIDAGDWFTFAVDETGQLYRARQSYLGKNRVTGQVNEYAKYVPEMGEWKIIKEEDDDFGDIPSTLVEEKNNILETRSTLLPKIPEHLAAKFAQDFENNVFASTSSTSNRRRYESYLKKGNSKKADNLTKDTEIHLNELIEKIKEVIEQAENALTQIDEGPASIAAKRDVISNLQLPLGEKFDELSKEKSEHEKLRKAVLDDITMFAGSLNAKQLKSFYESDQIGRSDAEALAAKHATANEAAARLLWLLNEKLGELALQQIRLEQIIVEVEDKIHDYEQSADFKTEIQQVNTKNKRYWGTLHVSSKAEDQPQYTGISNTRQKPEIRLETFLGEEVTKAIVGKGKILESDGPKLLESEEAVEKAIEAGEPIHLLEDDVYKGTLQTDGKGVTGTYFNPMYVQGLSKEEQHAAIIKWLSDALRTAYDNNRLPKQKIMLVQGKSDTDGEIYNTIVWVAQKAFGKDKLKTDPLSAPNKAFRLPKEYKNLYNNLSEELRNHANAVPGVPSQTTDKPSSGFSFRRH